MQRTIAVIAVLVLSFAAGEGRAFTVERGQGLKNKVVGGYWSNGIGFVAGDGYERWLNLFQEDRTPVYSPGGGLYFDYYLGKIVAIEAGFGFMSKGVRFKWNNDNILKERVAYMEIPVMAKVDIQHIQVAAGLVLFVGLSGKRREVIDNGNTTITDKWNGEDWEHVHRVNLGPKIAVSYAIPVGPIYIVPGLSWMMHFINDLDNDRIAEDTLDPNDETHYQMRAVNLMFNVGVEWAF